MPENKIGLKSISELLGIKFFIPSYQRGYRWGKLQIESLLNDIDKFNEQYDGEFYCLQPLVVKIDESKNQWRVIDGQQRLTTIYLILREFIKSGIKFGTYSLEYERDSYISKCNNTCAGNIDSSNIEIYHLTTAKRIINDWIKQSPDVGKESFLNKLLNNTKFIFYDVGNSADEHSLFNNLNSGKIALTNAELIKALFLNKVGNEDVPHREVEQRLLADEFDQIERTLRQDDFWYFLAGNEDKPSSCINLLFDMIFEADEEVDKKKYPEYDIFRTFFYFNDKINYGDRTGTYNKSKVLWEDVRRVFHIMEGWFNDSFMYNLIGYHRAVNGKRLAVIYKKFKVLKSKQKFKDWLKEESIVYVNYPDEFMNLRYDTDKSSVFNLLLLFNIASLLKKPQERIKFSFANFHQYKWDVEHISPQNPKDNVKLLKAVESKEYGEIFNVLIDALRNNNEKKLDAELKKFFAIDDELMSIGNLTLLTSHDNRGIGNRFFFEKRQKLQDYYQEGSYIPMCSMNVFLKFYTQEPDQMLFWSETDRKNYTSKINDTINDFFKKQNSNEQR